MKQSITTKLSEIINKRVEAENAAKAYHQVKKDLAKSLVLEMAEDIMSLHPEIEMILWNQYTPYRNDGEECRFSICEPLMRLSKSFTNSFSEQEKICFYCCNDDGKSEDIYELSFYSDFSCSEKIKSLAVSIREFYNLLLEFEDVMEEVFGNHCTIRIARDRTLSFEEYEHS